jgi:hypothetical protein
MAFAIGITLAIVAGGAAYGAGLAFLVKMWGYYATGGDGEETWENMETGGSAETAWEDLES